VDRGPAKSPHRTEDQPERGPRGVRHLRGGSRSTPDREKAQATPCPGEYVLIRTDKGATDHPYAQRTTASTGKVCPVRTSAVATGDSAVPGPSREDNSAHGRVILAVPLTTPQRPIPIRRRILRKLGHRVHRHLGLPLRGAWGEHRRRVATLPTTPLSDSVTFSEIAWIRQTLLTDDYWLCKHRPNVNHPRYQTVRRLTVGRDLTPTLLNRMDPPSPQPNRRGPRTPPASPSSSSSTSTASEDDPQVSRRIWEQQILSALSYLLEIYRNLCDLQAETRKELQDEEDEEEKLRLEHRYVEFTLQRRIFADQLTSLLNNELRLTITDRPSSS